MVLVEVLVEVMIGEPIKRSDDVVQMRKVMRACLADESRQCSAENTRRQIQSGERLLH